MVPIDPNQSFFGESGFFNLSRPRSKSAQMVEVIRRGREELLDKIAIAYKAVLPRIPQNSPVWLVEKLLWCAYCSNLAFRIEPLYMTLFIFFILQSVISSHTRMERLCFETLWWFSRTVAETFNHCPHQVVSLSHLANVLGLDAVTAKAACETRGWVRSPWCWFWVHRSGMQFEMVWRDWSLEALDADGNVSPVPSKSGDDLIQMGEAGSGRKAEKQIKASAKIREMADDQTFKKDPKGIKGC